MKKISSQNTFCEIFQMILMIFWKVVVEAHAICLQFWIKTFDRSVFCVKYEILKNISFEDERLMWVLTVVQ